MGAPPFSNHLKEDIELWVQQIFGGINSKLRKMNYLDSAEWIRGAKTITSNSVFIT